LQGDLPTLDPDVVRVCVRVLDNPAVDIATAVCAITEESERTNPNVVKAVSPCPKARSAGEHSISAGQRYRRDRAIIFII
jgi:3-deoxy-manno-octulosonate cytidylyltransferase (CMP-KDO synthetase)